MELILNVVMVGGLWGSIALLVWAGLLCAHDTFAAERRNAATPKRRQGRNAEPDNPHARLVVSD